MLNLARRIVVGTLAMVLISASAFAQTAPPKAARDNYDKGVAAAKAQKWQEAITALNAAIAVDGTPRSWKEGVYQNDYYPQAYLFIAYVGMKDFAKAQALVAQRGMWPAKVQADAKTSFDAMNAETKRIADANAAAKAVADKAAADKAAADKAAADKAAADKLAADKAAADKLAADKAAADKAAADRAAAEKRNADLAEFNRAVTAGNKEFNSKNWGGAVAAFTQAKTKLPNDFNSQQGLQQKLNEATKNKADKEFFDNAVKTADAAFAKNQFVDAATNYRAAQGRNPSEFSSLKLQAKLDKADVEAKKMGAEQAKKAEIDSMVRNADGALGQKRFDDAIAGYNAVKAKYAPEFTQRGLQAKIDEATRGKTQAANDKAAADRAAADRLAAAEKEKADRLAAAEKEKADKAAAAQNAANAAQLAERNAHDGLLALLTGDSVKASSLLEQALSEAPNAKPSRRATLTAYLAVAHAAQSIQKNDKTLESKARDEFKQAQSIQKGYKLEDSLVSPQVKKLLTGTN